MDRGHSYKKHRGAGGAVLALVALFLIALAPSAPAQVPGMPVWNSPAGGTGLLVAGDVGFLQGGGHTYAGRAGVGLGGLDLSGTLGVRSPGSVDEVTSYGGLAALRLAGGGLMSLALNAQAGYGVLKGDPKQSRYTAALGIGVRTPVPGFDVEPWVAPGFRVNHYDASSLGPADSSGHFGVAMGVNATFGLMGAHFAVDHESGRGPIYGLGLHLKLGSPVP